MTGGTDENVAVPAISLDTTPEYVDLVSNRIAWFRNIKVWVPDVP